jgi:hypothetical protein
MPTQRIVEQSCIVAHSDLFQCNHRDVDLISGKKVLDQGLDFPRDMDIFNLESSDKKSVCCDSEELIMLPPTRFRRQSSNKVTFGSSTCTNFITANVLQTRSIRNRCIHEEFQEISKSPLKTTVEFDSKKWKIVFDIANNAKFLSE